MQVNGKRARNPKQCTEMMKEARGVLTLVVEREVQPALNGHAAKNGARNGHTANGHHASYDTLLRI